MGAKLSKKLPKHVNFSSRLYKNPTKFKIIPSLTVNSMLPGALKWSPAQVWRGITK